jgi:hypothetical protein
MKQAMAKDPIAAYALPPHPPEAVTEAQTHFDRLGEKWAATKDELREAKAAVKAAKAEDVRAAAETYAAGKTPREPTKREDAAREKVNRLEAELAALNLALDEAGNDLAEAVAANREEWAATLEAAADEAAERYAEAITEAQAALAELRPARGAAEWLRDFDLSQAVVGYQPQFHGGRIVVEGDDSDPMRGEHRPEDLLRLAAKATDPPKPTTRKLSTAIRRA